MATQQSEFQLRRCKSAFLKDQPQPADPLVMAHRPVIEAILVDGSRVFRDLVARLIAPQRVLLRTAESIAEAVRLMEFYPKTRLVMCASSLPDGCAADLMWRLQKHDECGRAAFVLIAADPEKERGELPNPPFETIPKPVSPADLNRIVERVATADSAPVRRNTGHRARRVPCSGRAAFFRPPETQPTFVWDIYDLSRTGAFLDTRGALPRGTTLELELSLPTGRVRVKSEVVRAQPLPWLGVVGSGVRFLGVDTHAQRVIDQALSQVGA